jgi:hypothetical protein
MKKMSKKKEFWIIAMPEPYSLDPILREEDLIQTMSGFSDVDEMNNFLFECLKQPSKKIIVSVSEFELFGMFNGEKENFIFELVKTDDKYIIVIKDSEQNILGQGEVYRLGKKTDVDEMEKELMSNINCFQDQYKKNMNKIEGLIFRAQTLRQQMQKTQDLKENN